MNLATYRLPQWLACPVVLLTASIGSAQSPAFNVRMLDVTGALNNHYQAKDVLDGIGTVPGSVEFDGALNTRTVNFNGRQLANTFAGNELYPDGEVKDRDDYALQATAKVTIPAGDWSIAFGSDAGGHLSLPGASFLGDFNRDDPDSRGGSDGIWFNENRGHAWTGGHFSVGSAGLESTLEVTMHDRSGNDSLELAIRSNADFEDSEFVSEATGWELLADGVLDWRIETEAVGQIFVAGNRFGRVAVPGRLTNVVESGGGDTFEAGLAQRWAATGNPASRDQVVIDQITSGLLAPPFRTDPTWFEGNHSLIDGIPRYPAAIGPSGFEIDDTSANNDDFSVRFTGEILFEKNGTYRFRDGVDEYTYLAIDTDMSGIAGDSPAEILVDDNDASGPTAVFDNMDFNRPSPEVAVDIADAGVDGTWKAIELVVADGGADDSGILYWDYDTGTQTPGGNFSFPSPGIKVNPAVAQDVAIPNSHLRSTLPGDIVSADIVGKLDTLNEYVLQVSSKTLDADRLVLDNPNSDVITTKLDVSGATIRVVADGELIVGDQWVLMNADEIIGLDDLKFEFDNPANWDLSALPTMGRIKFVEGTNGSDSDCNQDGTVNIQDANCTPDEQLDDFLASLDPPSLRGDVDGDGMVQFFDFVTVSTNFGLPGQYTDGDLDKDGTVQFGDFVLVTSLFGQSAGGGVAAAVPEPSSLALMGLGLLALGIARRRRR